MSPVEKIRRKLLRNVEAKVLPYFILTLLVIASFTTLFLMPNAPLTMKGSAAYTDYSSVKKITIDSSYIDSELTNFPVLVHDDSGDLSDILEDGSDIAFFSEDNNTQYNHEIESYDSGTGELFAWVNITTVASDADTIFYMYYDDSDGGYAIGNNPADVWNDHYVAVYHMNRTDTTLWDSTRIRDATQHRTVDETTGKIGNAQDFESTNEGNFTATKLGSGLSLTVECWYKMESNTGANQVIIEDRNYAATNEVSWYFWLNTDNKLNFNVYGQEEDWIANPCASTGITAGSYFYLVGVLDDDSFVKLFYNTSLVGSDLSISGDLYHPSTSTIRIGADTQDLTPTYRYFADGIVDEIRISDSPRSRAWLNATFHSTNETTGFMTFGAESSSEPASTFTINGLPDDRITWAGTEDTSVWCNATGTDSETLELNITANSTTNVTEVRVWVGDMNDTDAFINASNITLHVSSDNSSFDTLNTFTDGGSNISINSTTWPVGAGGNPFDDAGICDTTQSIYLRFKVAIPSGTNTDEFYSSAIDAWKLYIGHYV